MMKIFGLLATPLGYVLHWVAKFVPSYFVAIFLFTLLIKLVLFPLNISSQKSATQKARLAPRLERLQKKYAQDRQKMAQKQQELYEKENVKMTGGCLPQLLQMLVLFSVIAVIYKPLTYVSRMDAAVLNTSTTAVVSAMEKEAAATIEKNGGEATNDAIEQEKVDGKTIKSLKAQLQNENSYYRELYLLKYMDAYTEDIRQALVEAAVFQKAMETRGEDVSAEAIQQEAETAAAEAITTMQSTKKDFEVFGISLLGVPSETGIRPNWLWVIAILSGLSSFLTSMLSMHFSQAGMTQEQQNMGGCSTKAMMYMMPLMSLYFSFIVPAGVAVYWIFSNLLALVQTAILNKMYNPAKIRAEAEAEYAERRRQKAEDKARLKQARLEEQAAWQREENEKRAAKEGKRPPKKAPEAEQTDDGSENNE